MPIGVNPERFLLAHRGDRTPHTPADARLALLANAAELAGAQTYLENVADLEATSRSRAVPVRRYAVTSTASSNVIYLHGGGFVVGDLQSADAVSRRLAVATRHAVISVDYRRAPEHPFPAAVEDVDTVLTWLARTMPGRPLGLVGDSAGANLAVVAALRALRRGQRVDRIALVYPVVDLRHDDRPSASSFGHGFGLDAETLDWYHHCYVPDPETRTSAEVSPILADLRGLPPILVITAECDPLRDQGEEFARALIDAGTPAVCTRYQGELHGFLRAFAVTPSAELAIAHIAGHLLSAP